MAVKIDGNGEIQGLTKAYDASKVTYTDPDNVLTTVEAELDSHDSRINSVEGRTAAGVGFTPTGSIAATNVQAAIAEVASDLAASSGSSLVGYMPAGTGAVATDVESKLREFVSVKDFGAVGDGVTDDTAAIYKAIQAAKAGIVFDGVFLLASPPPFTPAVEGIEKSYIPILSRDGFVVDASKARFIVTYDFVTAASRASLFGVIGSRNVKIDVINCYAPSQSTSRYTYGVRPVSVIDDGFEPSRNVYIESIDCKNVASCIHSGLSGSWAQYGTNGFAANLRSSGIRVGSATMINDADLTKAGYGIELQFAGDDFHVKKARFVNAYRSLIAYGVRRVNADIWATNHAAAGLAIGGYGSIEDFEIRLKDDGPDSSGGPTMSRRLRLMTLALQAELARTLPLVEFTWLRT